MRVGRERHAQRIVCQNAARAGDQVDAAVGARAGGVMLHQDGAPAVGADQRAVHVAQPVARLGLRAVFAVLLRRRLTDAELIAADRGEELETVAAVDVHVLADRAEAVRRIGVAGVLLRPFKPPLALIAVLVVFAQLAHAKVMDVGSLAMHQVTQNAFPAEIQGQHLVVPVAAVFQHHAVAARLFRSVDQLPALLQRHGGRHFDRRVLAALHRIDRHRRVPQPGRADVDQIDLAGFAQRAPRVA